MKRKRNPNSESYEFIENMSYLSLEKDSKKSKFNQSISLKKLDTVAINDLSLEELEKYKKVLKKKINKYSDYLEKIENILNLYI